MRCIWLALNIIAATPYGPMMTASPGHRTGWRRMCYSVRRRARGARERGQAGRYSTLKGGDVAHISAARDRAARDRADAGHHFARIGRDRVPRHSGHLCHRAEILPAKQPDAGAADLVAAGDRES